MVESSTFSGGGVPSNVVALSTASGARVVQSWRGRYPKSVARLADRRQARIITNLQASQPGKVELVAEPGGEFALRLHGQFKAAPHAVVHALRVALDWAEGRAFNVVDAAGGAR
ncbi:hypothetical protein [Paraburkholderia bannensis]|uniref:hypothetical protein n=1 Tax=Paraburkholderia bannensis TaxID=765414 RepID=UPI002ABDC13A|nr:hypothetical protein [Paraburkholderia bannensis]